MALRLDDHLLAALRDEDRCPACGAAGQPFRSAAAIRADLSLAAAWSAARDRARHPVPRRPVQADASDVAVCAECGTLWRAAAGLRRAARRRYLDDRYDARELTRLHEIEYATYRRDRSWFASRGLAPGTRVLEVGAYVGAFQRLARELGCDAHGLDLGRDTTAFCRSLGYDVRQGDLRGEGGQDAPSGGADGDGGYDSIWILTCFDQMADVRAALDEAHRLLVPGGRIVIHTPDAAAVRRAYLLGGPSLFLALDEQLWGVPFLACYSRRALRSLLSEAGFRTLTCRQRHYEPGHGAGWLDAVGVRPA